MGLASIKAVPSLVEHPVASEAHVLYCFDVLSAHLQGAEPSAPCFDVTGKCALFVSWHRTGGQLRGCIGSLRPLPFSECFRNYALTSALRDRRFAPITQHELPDLKCTVQLLGCFEPCAHLTDWDPSGVHGVTISFLDENGTTRSAIYLPDVMPGQGWGHYQAIDSLIRKSGYSLAITDTLRKRLEVQRFTSTKCSLHYEHWARIRCGGSQHGTKAMPVPTYAQPYQLNYGIGNSALKQCDQGLMPSHTDRPPVQPQ